MICPFCNNEINDNSKICEFCGKNINGDFANATENQDESTNGFYGEPITEKPKESKVAKFITIGLLIVVALIAAAVIVFFPYFKNQFRNIFYSNEKYMAGVINDDFSDVADDVSVVYGKIANGKADQSKQTVSLNISNSAKSLLKDYAEIDLGKLNDISLETEIADENSEIYCGAKLNINGKNTANANLIADKNGAYFKTDLLDNNYYKLDGDKNNVIGKILSARSSLPSEKTVKKLICKYGKVATSNLKNVSKDDEKVTFGNLSVETTELSGKISDNIVIDAAEDILNTAVNDEDIKKIIKDICKNKSVNGNYKDALKDYEDFLDGIKDKISDVDFKKIKEAHILLTINVDNRGNIVSRTVEVKDKLKITVYSLEKGKKIAYGISLDTEDKTFQLLFDGTKTDNKSSGKVYFKYGSLKLDIGTFKDVDFSDFANGNATGKICLTAKKLPVLLLKGFLGEDLTNLLSTAKINININANANKNSSDISVDIIGGGETLLNLRIESKKGKVNIPKMNNIKKFSDVSNEKKIGIITSLGRILSEYIDE